ncbi:MAG: ABC transporter substrate-binding protein [Deltaproteobacteria bacterium]
MSNTLRAVTAGTVGMLFLSMAAHSARAQAESKQPEPYASIAAKGVEYSGPGRKSAYDLTGTTIAIGLIVPLGGTHKADGEAIIAAAKMALADTVKEPLPDGRKLILKTGDESGPSWSGVTSALTHLVFDQQAVAIITSTSGATAHLSEQVGNRFGVPVLTLASDKTTTQIDLPWIFRLGPTDALEARTIAQVLYHGRGLKNVMLVTEDDHDGRRGAREFQDAARALGAPLPASMVLDPSRTDVGAFAEELRVQSPEAIVLWTTAPTTRTLIEAALSSGSKAAIYLSQEAAQSFSGVDVSPVEDSVSENSNRAEVWTVAAARTPSQAQEDFARRYRQVTGHYPSPTAAEAYDAVRLVATALRDAGPNRARIRDRIAKTRNWTGMSGTISFDAEGNNAAQIRPARVLFDDAGSEMTRRN